MAGTGVKHAALVAKAAGDTQLTTDQVKVQKEKIDFRSFSLIDSSGLRKNLTTESMLKGTRVWNCLPPNDLNSLQGSFFLK